MAEVVIGFGKAKPMDKEKSDSMGESPPESSKAAEVDEFDAAVEDAVSALAKGDTTRAKEALRAAITACCADAVEGA